MILDQRREEPAGFPRVVPNAIIFLTSHRNTSPTVAARLNAAHHPLEHTTGLVAEHPCVPCF